MPVTTALSLHRTGRTVTVTFTLPRLVFRRREPPAPAPRPERPCKLNEAVLDTWRRVF